MLKDNMEYNLGKSHKTKNIWKSQISLEGQHWCMRDSILARLMQTNECIYMYNCCYQHQPLCHTCSSEQDAWLHQIQASRLWWKKCNSMQIAWKLYLVYFTSWQPLDYIWFLQVCAFWKTEENTVFLCNSVSIIGGKLVGSVGFGNGCIEERSLKFQNLVVHFLFCQSLVLTKRAKVVLTRDDSAKAKSDLTGKNLSWNLL